MMKIAIIGSSGSGKSTLARQLGELLGIDVVHLDRLYWRTGWVETPREEWTAVQKDLIKKNSWIIDGNYGGTMDVRLAAADTVIFLDLPRTLCVYRVIKRRVQYNGRSRLDMGEGCEEKIDLAFVKWIWDFPVEQRPEILKRLNKLREGKRIIHLRSGKDVADFLRESRKAAIDARNEV